MTKPFRDCGFAARCEAVASPGRCLPGPFGLCPWGTAQVYPALNGGAKPPPHIERRSRDLGRLSLWQSTGWTGWVKYVYPKNGGGHLGPPPFKRIVLARL